MNTEETINKFLLNRLNDVCTPDRVAVYITNGILEICIPESIFFDPVTKKGKLKKIYAGGVTIDGSKLDKELMIKLFHKLSVKELSPKEKQEAVDRMILEKYRIEGKITKKKMKNATKEIQKYEQIIADKR